MSNISETLKPRVQLATAVLQGYIATGQYSTFNVAEVIPLCYEIADKILEHDLLDQEEEIKPKKKGK